MERELQQLRQQLQQLLDENRTLRARVAELESDMVKDPLTGVGNRKAFDLALQRAIADRLRYDRPVSLILLDVDGLKHVNDRFGHPAGDDLLQRVAHGLSKGLRANDHLSRIGGDEFAVILPGIGSEHGTLAMQRILDVVNQTSQNGPYPTTISGGMASYDDKSPPEVAAPNQADSADALGSKSSNPDPANHIQQLARSLYTLADRDLYLNKSKPIDPVDS